MTRFFKFLINAGVVIYGSALALCFSRPPLTPEQERLRLLTKEWEATTTRGEAELPDYIDNSRNKYFPAIFNQGSNNACSQAAGVRYVYSYEVNRLLDRDATDPDNVFCYHFTWNYLNEGSNQGSHAFLGYELMKECGAMPLSIMNDQPYSFLQQTQWLDGADSYVKAMDYRVDRYEKINLKSRGGIDNLRRFLFDHGNGSPAGGVSTISCYTEGWGFQRYSGPRKSDISWIVAKEGNDGPHAITITGYDDTVEFDFNGDGKIDDEERGAFIFVNSWGDDWGSGGRCLLPYRVLTASPAEGGLKESDADSYIPVPSIAPARMVFKVKVRYDRRDELLFSLGVADGSEAEKPTFEISSPIMNRQGGANPMQGWNAPEEIEVAFCFDRLYEKATSFADPKFFISVRRIAASGKGEILSFSVVDIEKGKVYNSHESPLALTGGLTRTATGGTSVSLHPSCSPWRWLWPSSKTPYLDPFVIATAAGERRKFSIRGYDSKSGTLTIRHRKL